MTLSRKFSAMAAIVVFLIFAQGLFGIAQAANGWYLRTGIGAYNSGSATFADESCAQTQPPALFGCQAGSDGRPIGAYGDFGSGLAIDLGVGHRFLPWLRAEFLLSWLSEPEYSGQANFLKVPGKQPVEGSGYSIGAFAVAWFDLPALGRWRPYLGVGVGAARNHIGPVMYRFPGLGAGDYTRTGGGSHVDFAWMLSAGVTVTMTKTLSLDIGLRYSDLGEMRTDAGAITIVRKGQTFVIDAGATRADFKTTSLLVALRYRF